jgi:hypothetical protein
MGKFFKGLRFIASALVGIPLAAVLSALVGALWAGFKAAEEFSKKILKDYFGDFIKADIAWKQRLDAIEGFFPKIWSGFGILAAKKTVEILGNKAAEVQARLGYGDSSDEEEDKTNYKEKENKLAVGLDKDFKKSLIGDIEKSSPTLTPKPTSGEPLKKEKSRSAD